jgi:hypothetical protein
MCEIFTLKKKKGYFFAKEELQGARNCNSDGAGVVVFNWDAKKKNWEVADFDLFKATSAGYSYANYDFTPYSEGAEDAEICETGKGHKKTISEFDEEEEQEYLKGVLSKKDYKALYPDDEPVTKALAKTETAYEHYEKSKVVNGFVYTKEDEAVEAIYNRQLKLKDGQLMIAHFRMATSGHTHDNTQPILAGDYITIHNGIFSYSKMYKGYSDTRYFSEKLKEGSKKLRKVNKKTEQALIEKLLDEAGGSYSIFIYSFKTGQIYYYKSQWASFNWAYNGIMGSTKESRFPVRYQSAQRKEVVTL